MKISYRTAEEKRKARQVYHNWFAWRPVSAWDENDGKYYIVWLETIQRKMTPIYVGYARYGARTEYKINCTNS
jgi:hypothetical protein